MSNLSLKTQKEVTFSIFLTFSSKPHSEGNHGLCHFWTLTSGIKTLMGSSSLFFIPLNRIRKPWLFLFPKESCINDWFIPIIITLGQSSLIIPLINAVIFLPPSGGSFPFINYFKIVSKSFQY